MADTNGANTTRGAGQLRVDSSEEDWGNVNNQSNQRPATTKRHPKPSPQISTSTTSTSHAANYSQSSALKEQYVPEYDEDESYHQQTSSGTVKNGNGHHHHRISSRPGGRSTLIQNQQTSKQTSDPPSQTANEHHAEGEVELEEEEGEHVDEEEDEEAEYAGPSGSEDERDPRDEWPDESEDDADAAYARNIKALQERVQRIDRAREEHEEKYNLLQQRLGLNQYIISNDIEEENLLDGGGIQEDDGLYEYEGFIGQPDVPSSFASNRRAGVEQWDSRQGKSSDVRAMDILPQVSSFSTGRNPPLVNSRPPPAFVELPPHSHSRGFQLKPSSRPLSNVPTSTRIHHNQNPQYFADAFEGNFAEELGEEFEREEDEIESVEPSGDSQLERTAAAEWDASLRNRNRRQRDLEEEQLQRLRELDLLRRELASVTQVALQTESMWKASEERNSKLATKMKILERDLQRIKAAFVPPILRRTSTNRLSDPVRSGRVPLEPNTRGFSQQRHQQISEASHRNIGISDSQRRSGRSFSSTRQRPNLMSNEEDRVARTTRFLFEAADRIDPSYVFAPLSMARGASTSSSSSSLGMGATSAAGRPWSAAAQPSNVSASHLAASRRDYSKISSATTAMPFSSSSSVPTMAADAAAGSGGSSSFVPSAGTTRRAPTLPPIATASTVSHLQHAHSGSPSRIPVRDPTPAAATTTTTRGGGQALPVKPFLAAGPPTGKSMNAHAAQSVAHIARVAGARSEKDSIPTEKSLKRRIASLNIEYRTLLREGASTTDAGLERLSELVEQIEEHEKLLRQLYTANATVTDQKQQQPQR